MRWFPAKDTKWRVPIEDSDQPAHLHSLVKVCDRRSKGSQGSNDSDQTAWKHRLIRILAIGTFQLELHAGYHFNYIAHYI